MKSPKLEAVAIDECVVRGKLPGPETYQDWKASKSPNIKFVRLTCLLLRAWKKPGSVPASLIREAAQEFNRLVQEQPLGDREQFAAGYAPMTWGCVAIVWWIGADFRINMAAIEDYMRRVATILGFVALPNRPGLPNDWLLQGPFVAIPGSRLASKKLQLYQSDASFWYGFVTGRGIRARWPQHPSSATLVLRAMSELLVSQSSIKAAVGPFSYPGGDPDAVADAVVELDGTRLRAPLRIIRYRNGGFVAYQARNTHGTNPPAWGYVVPTIYARDVKPLVCPNLDSADNNLSAGSCGLLADGRLLGAQIDWTKKVNGEEVVKTYSASVEVPDELVESGIEFDLTIGPKGVEFQWGDGGGGPVPDPGPSTPTPGRPPSTTATVDSRLRLAVTRAVQVLQMRSTLLLGSPAPGQVEVTGRVLGELADSLREALE